MEPITREEQLMAAAAGQAVKLPEPITREEMFLAAAAGQNVNLPEPITRREKLLSAIVAAVAGGGTGGSGGGTVDAVLEELTITENGEYTPRSGVDGFSKVIAAIETGGGGVAIQSGRFTPAENLYGHTIEVSGLVKNFCIWKATNTLGYEVRTIIAIFAIDGMPYQVYSGTNGYGSSAQGFTGSFITLEEGMVKVKQSTQAGYFVTEQYNWIAW